MAFGTRVHLLAQRFGRLKRIAARGPSVAASSPSSQASEPRVRSGRVCGVGRRCSARTVRERAPTPQRPALRRRGPSPPEAPAECPNNVADAPRLGSRKSVGPYGLEKFLLV